MEDKIKLELLFKESKNGLPSDLQSIFLDSAWAYNQATDEYYLHLFAKGQPDLNWHYKPVRESIYDILQFWIDLGVKGFRFDVQLGSDRRSIGRAYVFHQFC